MRLVKQLLIACLVLGILAAPAWAENNARNHYFCRDEFPGEVCDAQEEPDASPECYTAIGKDAYEGAKIGSAAGPRGAAVGAVVGAAVGAMSKECRDCDDDDGDPPEAILMIGRRRS